MVDLLSQVSNVMYYLSELMFPFLIIAAALFLILGLAWWAWRKALICRRCPYRLEEKGLWAELMYEKNIAEKFHVLHTAVEQSSSTIVITDKNGDIEYANPYFEKSTGYSVAEAIGKNPRILKSGKQAPGLYEELWEKLSSGKEWRGEFINKRKDGTFYWELACIAPVVDEKGVITHYVAVKDDITDFKEVEERLRNAKEEAERHRRKAEKASAAKSEFLAAMSHEIRTPMNGVLGMTDILLETELSEEQKELAQTLQASANSLLAVINDILDFSKIEAGKLDLNPIVFNLRGSVEEIESIFGIRMDQKDLEFIVEIDPEVPVLVYGDPDRLRQILVNLIGNSIKFTERGGAVTLFVRREENSKDEALLQFNITDTGIGIHPDRQQRIFEAFQQADSTTARRFGGTGLGLSISSRLVKLMGGEISLQSEPGKGTNFCFSARFGIGPNVTKDHFKRPEVKTLFTSSKSKHILLAEDNEVNQKVAVKLLEKLGHSIKVVENGKEAVESFENSQFDLIFMDIQMPVMGGEEAVLLIREKEKGRHVPIVALTAHAMTQDREKYLSMGFDAYVSKPINKKALYLAIEKLSK